MRVHNIPKKILLLLLAVSAEATAFAPTNFFTPYDSALMYPKRHTHRHEHKNFEFGIVDLEFGSRGTSRNWQGHRRNALQVHDDTERALSMLQNAINPNAFTQNAINMLQNALPGGGALDLSTVDASGTTGNILFTGKVKELDVSLYAKYTLPFECIPGKLGFALYLPIIYKKVYGGAACFQDLTPKSSDLAFSGPRDLTVANVVTNNLLSNVEKYGNLSLADWSHSSVGDLTAMIEWYYSQCESKDHWLKYGIFAKIGVSFPTGDEKNEDKAFSMAIGNDGAWGLPMGLSLSARFGKVAAIGLDSELLILFDKTRTRRLKTHEAQTEFLLINKAEAEKEYGITWQFHPYIHLHPWSKRCVLHLGYQYVRHEKDELELKKCDPATGFDNKIINTAHSLLPWHVHNVITRVTWEFCSAFHAGIFYKHSFDGRNLINMNTLGMQGRFRF